MTKIKKALAIVLFFTISLSSSITCYAEPEYQYANGEASRQYYYDLFLSDLDKNDLTWYTNKLAIEYLIFSDTLCDTDNYIFINMDCVERIYMQDIDLLMTKDDNGKYLYDTYQEKIDYLNAHIKYLNENIDKGIDEWWASLGNNYIKYIYILNNINNATAELNSQIYKYNKKTGDNLPYVNYMNKMYCNWSWKEAYEAYFEKGEFYSWKDEPKFFPQG